MPYESTFGELQSTGAAPARAGGDNPFRIAILGDFSARTQRQPPAPRDELAARKPIKVAFDSLDDTLGSVAPSVEFTAADDVEVRLEPTELDDFQPDPIYRNVDRLSDLEGEEAAALLRAIMHHPLYESLESTWRGLEWLLRRVNKNSRIQVVLLDMTAEEFAADLTAGDDLRASAIYRQLIEKLAEGVDPMPWAVLVGLYTFDETTAHAELLGRMARIAARAAAPFLTAITPQVVAAGYEVPADDKPAWEALRKLPESAYLGLAAPRFLLRPPFGENYRPAESLSFEEFSAGANDYLWGTPALAAAALLAQGFTQSGWGFQPSQFLSLGNMPMHSYRDADGEPVAVCGEGRFTSSTGQALAERGFMTLLSVRGRDAVELAAIRSMSVESPGLAGCWVGGTPSKKAAAASGSSVGMMAGTTGVQRPNRDGPTAVSSSKADSEIDPDLQALLGEADAPAEESTDESSAGMDEAPADESSGGEAPAEESASDALDPELAALLGDTGDAGASGAAEDSGLDPELAALLGDSPPEEEPASDALDPELAALLGDSPPADAPTEETPAEEAPISEGLDPELAALLGDSPTEAPAEEPPAEPVAESLDPELAALLGDSTESEPAEEPPAEPVAESLDPELAALLGDSAGAPEDAAGEEPAASADLDPELAALLGDTPAAESPLEEPAADPADTGLDPELAALLGDSPAAGETAEPTTEPEPTFDEPFEPTVADALAESSPPSDEPILADEPSTMQSRDDAMATADDASAATVDTPEQIQARVSEVQAASRFGAAGSGSPPVIDFLSLLQPVSAGEPAGGSVPFDVKEDLELARKEVNPELFAADDPLRPEDYIKADWGRIIDLTQQTLRESSKNLLIAARLLEALAKKQGFVGLRDGLHLLRLLVEVCWDRLEPPVEDDDLEVRAGPFHWIDDPDRGAVFPNSVRAMVLLSAGGNGFSWLQWQQSQGGPDKGGDIVEKTISAATRDQCQALVDNLSQAVMELKFLTQYLGTKLGPEAPGFTSLRPAMDDCLRLAKQILQRKGPAPEAGGAEENGEQPADGQTGGGPAVATGRTRLSTRQDIYHALAEAADALERLEPHSPVPFLVRRAVELGALPFPMLMAALIRDTAVLSEMNRELGIKEPAPAE